MTPLPARIFLTRILPRIFFLGALATLVPWEAGYAQSAPRPATSPSAHEQPVRATHAMVVSVQHDATDAGVAILKQGGNAVDAAVATGFALAVTHPAAGNIGGGGFMLIRLHGGKAIFLDYREKAPFAASRDMYLDSRGEVIPEASTVGYRAIGVPGSVAGMAYAEKKYGRLTLQKVMAPAIRLAEGGFVLCAEEAAELGDKDLARFPDSRRIFQRDGNLYKTGETLRQPELAATLRAIAADPDTFYHGEMAKKIAAAVVKGGGLITEKDLAAYEVKERQPLVGTYRGYTILGAPPPSSGGVALLEALNILEDEPLALGADRTAPEMQRIVEAYRRAYMDRSDYLGDADFSPVPVKPLVSEPYAAAWRAGIEPGKATPSSSLHRPAGFLPPPPKTEARAAEPGDTTHYSVVDAEGNAVAVTTTLNGTFGSYVTAAGLGFLLNNEMDDFAVKQGVPNAYGLIQGPANAIAPGKRPLSSMTPTIVLQDSKLRLVLGSPGGARIITTVANILLSVVDGGLNVQDAVDAPRFHHQYLPDVLYLEKGAGDVPPFATATVSALEKMGYHVQQDGPWSDGECIAIDPRTGMLEGGQDHRRHFGKAAGY